MILKPIITCEHGGNAVPLNYSHLFEGKGDVLQSHRGWDPGAAEVAAYLSKKLSAPFFICETTRLLVEPNRSLQSDALFSEYSKGLTEAEKSEILQHFYHPHRDTVEAFILNSTECILHLSIHTFTPVWNETPRNTDIGLLFDPLRSNEAEFCDRFQKELIQQLPSTNIEFNEPYKGIDDGFTTHLRTLFPNERYLGIEIELNQKYVGTPSWNRITTALSHGLVHVFKNGFQNDD